MHLQCCDHDRRMSLHLYGMRAASCITPATEQQTLLVDSACNNNFVFQVQQRRAQELVYWYSERHRWVNEAHLWHHHQHNDVKHDALIKLCISEVSCSTNTALWRPCSVSCLQALLIDVVTLLSFYSSSGCGGWLISAAMVCGLAPLGFTASLHGPVKEHFCVVESCLLEGKCSFVF